MSNMFDYSVDEKEHSYNIKWTILKHIQYMINKAKVFKEIFPGGLSDDHFYDALSVESKNLPAFGVDYFGKRAVGGGAEDIYQIRYVGRQIEISANNRFGVESNNRILLFVHDLIINNFTKLNQLNKLEIFNFPVPDIEPVKSGHTFTMELLETVPSRDEVTHSRVNAMEFTFSVKFNF